MSEISTCDATTRVASDKRTSSLTWPPASRVRLCVYIWFNNICIGGDSNAPQSECCVALLSCTFCGSDGR